MENQQRIQYANQAIMLDLSLFVLDILDADKIKQKPENSDHILEVPGALTLMMRDAESGSPTLSLFIYLLLKKLRDKNAGTTITDQRLKQLVNAQEHQLVELASTASKRLFTEFLPLIEKPDIQIKTIDDFSLEQEKISQTFKYPIRRHDQIAELSPTEQSRLQEIYTQELNLPRHDLFDLYFAQVFHAQTIGFTGISNLRERTISLGEATFDIVYKWKWQGVSPILYENQEADKRIIKDGRHFITWFINTYLKEHRDEIWSNAKHDLPITLITEGPKGVGISLIMLAGGTVRDGIKEYGFKKSDEQILNGIVSVVVTLTIILLCGGGSWLLIQQTQNKPAPPTLLSTPNALPTAQPTYTFTPIPPTPIPITNTPIPPTPLPSSTPTTIFDSNYCRYLTQPGDTAQSISSWFGISEAIYRAENNSHIGTELTAGQIVYISAPCCNAQYAGWQSYIVKQGDRIFSIAENYGISPELLAQANHITKMEYIQVDQMLCVPRK